MPKMSATLFQFNLLNVTYYCRPFDQMTDTSFPYSVSSYELSEMGFIRQQTAKLLASGSPPYICSYRMESHPHTVQY